MVSTILSTMLPFIVLLIVLAFLKEFIRSSQKRDKVSEPSPLDQYEKKDLMTAAERSFYGVLKVTINGKAEIFTKVSISDVLGPSKHTPSNRKLVASNRINQKHFDFVLCSSTDLSPLCAIELNDKSHQRKDRVDRDEFVRYACESAGFPLIEVPARAGYRVEELSAKIAAALWEDSRPSVGPVLSPVDDDFVVFADDKPICSKCSSSMIKRASRKGQHAGREVWVCSRYPECREVVPA